MLNCPGDLSLQPGVLAPIACKDLSNPLPCGSSPCSLEAVEGAVSASGGLFPIVYSEPQDKWCPCLPGRGGFGTLCQKSHGPGAVYVLIFSPLLPNTEDIFQRQVIDFSLALPAQSFVSFEAMQVRDPCTTAQSSSVWKQKGLCWSGSRKGRMFPFPSLGGASGSLPR